MAPLRCETCGHPWTFHGSGKTPCQATGCECRAWKGKTLLAHTTITVPEAARHTGRSQTFIREHAKALGGVEVPLKDLGIRRNNGTMLRFKVATIDRKLPILERKLARG